MPTQVDFERPLYPQNTDEPVCAHETIVRDMVALALDRSVRCLSRVETNLDRVVAKGFMRLKRGTHLLDLGDVRFGDDIDACGWTSLRSA